MSFSTCAQRASMSFRSATKAFFSPISCVPNTTTPRTTIPKIISRPFISFPSFLYRPDRHWALTVQAVYEPNESVHISQIRAKNAGGGFARLPSGVGTQPKHLRHPRQRTAQGVFKIG